MPLAGSNPHARASAHLRWAERYHREGKAAKAMAHFGRGLDYESMLRFGTIKEQFDEFIEFISFVPKAEQVSRLIRRGVQVKSTLDQYKADPGKMDQAQKADLIASMGKKTPKKGNSTEPEKEEKVPLPHETVLSKNATFSNGKGGKPNPVARVYRQYGLKLAVAMPRSTPYVDANMGPQICAAVSDDNSIINLFHLSEGFVRNAVEDVTRYAAENELTMIQALQYMCMVPESDSEEHMENAVKKAQELESVIGLDTSKEEDLEKKIKTKQKAIHEKEQLEHFRNVNKMLSCVEDGIHRKGLTLTGMGLKLELFCQTWDVDSLNPNFSIPSPHFQTCLIITNEQLLRDRVDATEAHIASFQSLATAMRSSMANEDYRHKFVLLSALTI